MVGASIMSGFDNRNELAVERQTGGVLQLAQYVAGLSGTSWLVGTYSLAGFPTFESRARRVRLQAALTPDLTHRATEKYLGAERNSLPAIDVRSYWVGGRGHLDTAQAFRRRSCKHCGRE